MPRLSSLFTRRSALLTGFLDARQQELGKAVVKKDRSSEKFVPYASLEAIWSGPRLREFVDLIRPGFDHHRVRFVKENLLRTLSILVYIGWPYWESFAVVFLHHRDSHGKLDRLDDRIPHYTSEALCAFLGDFHAERFLTERCTFCPIDLEEGKAIYFNGDWRLPFVAESEQIGAGGYGQVTKEVIAKRHFIASAAHGPVPNENEYPVARKRYANRRDFKREAQNLEYLRSSLCRHENIISYLSIVAIGEEYNIIFPLADVDLDGFLRGDNSTVVDASLPDLIGEARNVVGALSFLHGMLQTNNPGRICCHNDLKPANILVYADSESRVGRWKIADFGISIVTEPDDPVADSLAVTVTPDGTPTVHQPPARNPSTYQAPEVCHDNGQIGRKSDVWSMGCILVRILARGISPLELQDLDRSRGLTMEGAEYNDDYFHRGSPARLNPHIDHWLAEMPGRCLPGALPDFWNESSDLLRRMLAINRRERPTAESVFQRLSRIERLADPRSSPFTRSTSGRSGRSTQSSKPTPPTPPPPPPPTLPADGPQPIPVRYVVEAIQSRQMENLENLLSIGCDIEGSWEGDRPLIHAIRAKSIEAVNILHRYKPALDAETHDRHGLTPLAAAAVQGDPELVDRVLEIPASIDGRSQSGITALMLAARQGHQQVVETLLNQGASSGAYSADGWTPWHYAVCGSGTADLIRLFASRRSIDINTPTEKGGETPLLTLVNWYQRGDQWWDKFTALRDTPANVNHPDVSGNTPLSVAVDADRVKLADSLIQWGASVSSATPSKHLSLDMRNLVKRAQRNQGHRRDSILSFSSPRHSFSSTNSPGSRP